MLVVTPAGERGKMEIIQNKLFFPLVGSLAKEL